LEESLQLRTGGGGEKSEATSCQKGHELSEGK